MFFGAGTIGQQLKGMKLQHNWNEKKKNGDISGNTYLDMIKKMQEKKDDYNLSTITMKLNAGKKLTSGEMEYLKENNPSLYDEAVKVARARHEYEQKLKNCRTKDEVSRVQAGAISGLMQGTSGGASGSGGIKIMTLASINDAHRTFIVSKEYAELPREQEDEDKTRRKKTNDSSSGVIYGPGGEVSCK